MSFTVGDGLRDTEAGSTTVTLAAAAARLLHCCWLVLGRSSATLIGIVLSTLISIPIQLSWNLI